MTLHESSELQISDTVSLASKLIQFDTTNYGSGKAKGEQEIAAFVAQYLHNLGLHPQIIESSPRRANVIARVPGKERDLDALVVHGHLDVVPAVREQWSVDPFAGLVRDGMLWGRGAVDMKNMCAMILTSVAEILRSGGAPRRDLILAFFADEEDGGEFGSGYMVQHHADLFAGASTAISEVGGYSIDLDGQRAYLIQTGEKAMEWIRLRARGTAAHGSRVWHDNAVTKLAEAVAALGTHEWPVVLCDTTEQLLSKIAEIYGEDPKQVDPETLLLRTGSAGGFISASLRTTTNPTALNAGYKHNVIPESAEALIDIRCLPADQETVLLIVQEIVGEHIEIEVVHSDIGMEVPFAAEIVDQMTSSLHKYDPEARVLPYLLSGGTDNKALSKIGITGYGFSPLQLPANFDFPGMFHGVDERVPVSAIDFGQKVLHDFLVNY